MASGIYNRAFYDLCTGQSSLSGVESYMVVLVQSYTFNKDHCSYPDVSATEITGTGYTAGGNTLLSPAVTQDDANDWAKWDAADETWTSATFSTHGAVVMHAPGSDVTSMLVCFFSFGTNQTVSSGDFTIQWDSNGLITFAQA
jgi:hypothetical protein